LQSGEQRFRGNDRHGWRGWRQGPAPSRKEESRQPQPQEASEFHRDRSRNKISS